MLLTTPASAPGPPLCAWARDGNENEKVIKAIAPRKTEEILLSEFILLHHAGGRDVHESIAKSLLPIYLKREMSISQTQAKRFIWQPTARTVLSGHRCLRTIRFQGLAGELPGTS